MARGGLCAHAGQGMGQGAAAAEESWTARGRTGRLRRVLYGDVARWAGTGRRSARDVEGLREELGRVDLRERRGGDLREWIAGGGTSAASSAVFGNVSIAYARGCGACAGTRVRQGGESAKGSGG